MANPGNHTDAELISRLMKGDEKAFAHIYDACFPALYQHAYVIVQDEDIAKDVVQNVFIYLWENRETADRIHNLPAYLYRAMRNAVLNELKRERIQAGYLEDFGRTLQKAENTTDHLVRERELQAAIDREIEHLPPRMREVFRLKREENLSYKEIAERLDISDLTAKSHITRALHQLWTKFSGIIMLLIINTLK